MVKTVGAAAGPGLWTVIYSLRNTLDVRLTLLSARPSFRTSSPFGEYQIILVGCGRTCARTILLRLFI